MPVPNSCRSAPAIPRIVRNSVVPSSTSKSCGPPPRVGSMPPPYTGSRTPGGLARGRFPVVQRRGRCQGGEGPDGSGWRGGPAGEGGEQFGQGDAQGGGDPLDV